MKSDGAGILPVDRIFGGVTMETTILEDVAAAREAD